MNTSEKLRDLNEMLNHARKSDFYANRLSDGPFVSLDQLKTIPVTTKEHLREQSPSGLLCSDTEELYQYHESSGTTGEPVSSWFTREDINYNVKQIISCSIDINSKDIVLVRFPYNLSGAAHMMHRAAQSKKACVVPASGTATIPFTKVVNLLKKLDVTILSCLSLQAVIIAETAEILGLNPKGDFPNLRAIFTAGETLSPYRRQLIEDIWGVPVYEFYGMTEIGTAIVDCEHFQTHAIEGDFVFEILDDTLTKEVQSGQFGHLVITTLKKKATPMIRYLTGDKARIVEEPCPCGRSQRFEIRGRHKDTLFVNQRPLDLWDVEEIIAHLPCQRFWCASTDMGQLNILIEKEQPFDHLNPTQTKLLEAKFNLPLNIQLVPKGTLYDREQLLSVGLKGKPKYFYTPEEWRKKEYIHYK
ncbi:phenylacetate--CoA ligase family protein [Filobacillus milosensis]|uniref:Phenylacetate--CoA ligase family protein n=1 Tax=Filobacillus milosensis TaxID=94137 RepID=A0A4Y8IK77_9BACI|nr:AMP-binding protein [Filobacillus milosensis]TFB21366.1 phenylacetate--CoA ligase family protein [Filobacillus milosensis]